MIHKLDSTRLVVFEQAGAKSHTDVYSPMYMNMEKMKNYALSSDAYRPLIQCEYSHAMGNSLGNFQDYWNLIESYPLLQGGFVWDWVDQALEEYRDSVRFFDYGGGFGMSHFRNDANFCVNGIVNPDRVLNPHAYELRKVYQNFRVEPYDISSNEVVISNLSSFTNLSEYQLEWVLERDGRVLQTVYTKEELAP
ncbi:MAG: glycoside hydrolase family 2 TIM barrel-domain containing protein, partial [Bacteroidales bacterium]